MILPDVNLLLFAINSACPDHGKALAWWKGLLAGNERIGILPVVAFAFVRLSTNRKVFPKPLSVADAFGYLENWLQFPNVFWVGTEVEDLAVAKKLLLSAGTGANLVTDAQIAAVALRLKAKVHTADADFSRFPTVKWVIPLQPGR